jgi:SAM-dependent methyltransferase
VSRERERLSSIAHRGSAMWGPLGEPTIDEIVDRVVASLRPESRVLDLGCGPAELLRRVCERTGARGVGIDASPFAIDEARHRLHGSVADGRIELRRGDAREVPRRRDHHLVVCIGPGWDAGGWRAMTAWAAGFVAPGGRLLLGEGAWRRAPTEAELSRLGIGRGDYVATADVDGEVRAGSAEPDWTHRSTVTEWDDYASSYRRAMLDFAEANPEDRIVPRLEERAGPGWAEYELLHDLLDFVVVLARVADGASTGALPHCG